MTEQDIRVYINAQVKILQENKKLEYSKNNFKTSNIIQKVLKRNF